jgi:hypothetical protein
LTFLLSLDNNTPMDDEPLVKIRKLLVSRGLRESVHAAFRRKKRNISFAEVRCVLAYGFHEKSKTSFDTKFQCWKYAIRGKTSEGRDLRVIISVEKDIVFVITAISLSGNNHHGT